MHTVGLVGMGSVCQSGDMTVVSFRDLVVGGAGRLSFVGCRGAVVGCCWCRSGGGWSLVVVRCEAVLTPRHTEPRSCEGLDLSNFFTSPNCHMTMCC